MKMTILKSSIYSHGIDASRNQIHNGIDFSQRIDSVESMPGILKSPKIQALNYVRVEREKNETLLYEVYENRPN
jgi:hypothetical protein